MRLTTPKWLLGHALVVAVVVSFTQFGFWQLRRHAERSALNEVTLARASAAPVSLDEALAAAAAEVADGADPALALRDRRVRVAGWFEPDDEVLRRPVSRDGMPGYHVVTPLRLEGDADGRRLWVERGWVPDSLNRVPVAEAPPPDGPGRGRRLVARDHRAAAGVGGRHRAARSPDRPPGAGRVPGPREVARPGRRSAGAGRAVARVGRGRARRRREPAVAPEPHEVSMGPHLGYAIQWFAFVLVTVIGYAALLRRVLREG
jgi:surfeit locus 1 family protein